MPAPYQWIAGVAFASSVAAFVSAGVTRRVWPYRIAVACLATGLMVSAWSLHDAPSRFPEFPFAPEDRKWKPPAEAHTGPIEPAVALAGLGLLGASLAALWSSRRLDSTSGPTREWLLGALVGIASEALAFAPRLVRLPDHPHYSPSGSDQLPLAHTLLSSVELTISTATLAVALLGSALAAARWLSVRPSSAKTDVSTVVAGLLAFGATFDQGVDSRHLVHPPAESLAELSRDVATPMLSRCGPPRDTVFVTMDETGTFVGDRKKCDFGGAYCPLALDEALAKESEKLRYIAERNPVAPFTGELTIAADASLKMTWVAPQLGVVRRNGFTRPIMISIHPHRQTSRTLPERVIHTGCTRGFAFDPAGTPVSSFATWGDLAKALDQGDVRLALPAD
jgi:hypothetical protein